MRVNVGCGSFLKPGWLNLDILPIQENSSEFLQWDIRNRFPPLDNVIMIHSEHLMEHLLNHELMSFLNEGLKVLSPGGKMRACVPNFRQLCEKYLANDWDFFGHVRETAPNGQILEIINYALYQRQPNGVAEHVQVLDPEYAVFLLQAAGYKNCKEVPFDPDLDSSHRRPYSFYVEGTK